MKTDLIAALRRCGALIAVAVWSGAAHGSFTATATALQTEYSAGADIALNFSVTIAAGGEFADTIGVFVPAGMTVLSAAGPSPYDGCGGGKGNFSLSSNSAFWSTPGAPSGCGAFGSGTYNFSVTVRVAAGLTSPMTITATIVGDGYPPPLTDAQFSTIPIVLTYKPPFNCLDLNGNGNLDALTDGLMLLRALFGLTGGGVTNNAVIEPGQPLPPRFNWPQIRAYMNANCGTNFAP